MVVTMGASLNKFLCTHHLMHLPLGKTLSGIRATPYLIAIVKTTLKKAYAFLYILTENFSKYAAGKGFKRIYIPPTIPSEL